MTLTELETAILARIAMDRPVLLPFLGHLHVLSRELTGAGSYTTFAPGQASPDLPDGYLSLDALVALPGVPDGLGAVLSCVAGFPECLEIYTYGDQLWHGESSGFTVGGAA